MIAIEVDDTRALARLGNIPAKYRAALSQKITVLRLQLEGTVKTKLSGQVLNVKTGNLRRSIFSTQEESPTSVVASVASSSEIRYARIHEYGGKTAAHEILPVKANVLAFMIGGKQVFAKRVNHPGSRMPQRSFMRSSLKDMAPQIRAGMEEAVKGAVQ